MYAYCMCSCINNKLVNECFLSIHPSIHHHHVVEMQKREEKAEVGVPAEVCMSVANHTYVHGEEHFLNY